MELQSLTVTLREELGKNASRRVRRAGFVPAVLYGGGKDPVSLSIDYATFKQLVRGEQGEHAIVEVKVENNPEFDSPAILKGVQHHPVKETYVHADLMRIDLKKKIRTQIPIKLEGHSVGVIAGGVIDHQCRELEVECLALEVPDHIVAVITDLDIGHSLHVSDLTIPDGVELITAVQRSVVAVHAPRVVEETTITEGDELAEGIDGAEAATEESAADSKGDEGKDSE